MVSAVERGMLSRTEEEISRLGIDEKIAQRGYSYAINLTGISCARVLNLVPDRKLDAAKTLLDTLRPIQRASVKAVVLDMWPAFMSDVSQCVSQADIAHDKFHSPKTLGRSCTRCVNKSVAACSRRETHR